MGLFDFAGDILGIANAASGIAGMFGRSKETESEKASSAALERSQMLADALADPNNPRRREMANTHLQEQRDARLRGIAEFIAQEQRAARRNPRGPTFVARNPRRDEAVARAMMSAGQNEWAGADAAAKSDLATALTGQLQTGGFANQSIPFQQGRQNQQAGLLPGVFAVGRDLAGALGRTADSWGGGFSSPVAGNYSDFRGGGGYGGGIGDGRSYQPTSDSRLTGWV